MSQGTNGAREREKSEGIMGSNTFDPNIIILNPVTGVNPIFTIL